MFEHIKNVENVDLSSYQFIVRIRLLSIENLDGMYLMALILVQLETKTNCCNFGKRKNNLTFFFLLGHPLDLITEPQQHL